MLKVVLCRANVSQCCTQVLLHVLLDIHVMSSSGVSAYIQITNEIVLALEIASHRYVPSFPQDCRPDTGVQVDMSLRLLISLSFSPSGLLLERSAGDAIGLTSLTPQQRDPMALLP